VYYALETTGLLPRLHWPVYDNHHFDGKMLNEEKNLLDWLNSNGVDAARFKQAYESYEVTQKVNEARKMLETYDVKGVPSLVVDGHYVTSASRAGGVPQMMEVLEFLVARARDERNKK
jgi:thiol:disulfide interchange protein DsbA